MARGKVDIRCKCPYCGAVVVVHDYLSRWPERVCICRRATCQEKEAARAAGEVVHYEARDGATGKLVVVRDYRLGGE